MSGASEGLDGMVLDVRRDGDHAPALRNGAETAPDPDGLSSAIAANMAEGVVLVRAPTATSSTSTRHFGACSATGSASSRVALSPR